MEPGDGQGLHRRGKAKTLKVTTAAELRKDRSTQDEASFWQTHELPNGEYEAPRFSRGETTVLHLRLSKAALRRLKAKAAAAGVPLSTFASGILIRSART